jgi:hypothetical protein
LDSIPGFIEIVTKALSPVVDGFMLGIETNRGPLSEDMVEAGIGCIQQYAKRIVNGVEHRLPVGTHEQNVRRKNGKLYMYRRVPRNADFHGYETINHPFDGNNVIHSEMVEEVTYLAKTSGKAIWVVESNSEENSTAKEQNRLLAAIPGVVGVGGPM